MTQHQLKNNFDCNQPRMLIKRSISQKEEDMLDEVVWEEEEDKEVGDLKDPVPLPRPCRNEVGNLIRDIGIDIMKGIKLAITTAIPSQISEIAIAMATQIKTTTSTEMSTPTKKNMIMSPVELEEDLDPITQSPKMTNEESTPMEVDTDQCKRNVPTDIEATTTTYRITPSRNLRPQKHRGQVSIPKKTLKEGQNGLKKV